MCMVRLETMFWMKTDVAFRVDFYKKHVIVEWDLKRGCQLFQILFLAKFVLNILVLSLKDI